MIELFVNDNYRILKFLYDNQIVILNKKVIPLTQIEIANELNFSKMKVNAVFLTMQEQELIKREGKGKYSLTEKAEHVVNCIEQIDKIGG